MSFYKLRAHKILTTPLLICQLFAMFAENLAAFGLISADFFDIFERKLLGIVFV
jgi:hypothetical protein